MKWQLGGVSKNIWNEDLHLVGRRPGAIVVVRQLQQPPEEPIEVVPKLDVRRDVHNLREVDSIERRRIVVKSAERTPIAFFAGIANRRDPTFPYRPPLMVKPVL